MDTKRPLRSRSTALAAVSLVLGLTALPGCDNSACVFGGDCFGAGSGAGGLGAFPATFPEDGLWILNGPPSIEASFPSGNDFAATTALAVRFDESVAASTLTGSFALFEVGVGFGGELPVPLNPPALTGDARLVVLRPTAALNAGGSYELRGTDMPGVTDFEGNLVGGLAGAVLTAFTVEATASTVPSLITTYPAPGSNGQSRTTEIVAVFDRPIDPLSLNLATFQVRVDSQTPPSNPLPEPLNVPGVVGGLTPELRVATWRSVDATTGGALDLAASAITQPAPVTLTLAGLTPQGGGGPLIATSVNFTLLGFEAPTGAVLNTVSMNGIGIDDLIGAPPPYSIDVQLADGQADDVLELFLFGAAPDGSRDITLLRSKTLTAATMVERWDPGEIDLAPPDRADFGCARRWLRRVRFPARARKCRHTGAAARRRFDRERDPRRVARHRCADADRFRTGWRRHDRLPFGCA